MNICVIGGAGYVGLITGLGLAETGSAVINVDVDRKRINMLKAGESPIYEEGIEDLLSRNVAAGRISFTDDLHMGVSASEVIFIAVGTPSRLDGQADLSHVIQVAEELAKDMEGYKVIVIKSTVPVGAVELVRSILCRENQEGKEFDIVSNPEFLREGKGLYDFFYPDRIVIGTSSKRARAVMRALYEPIVLGGVCWPEEGQRPQGRVPVPVVETDIASAQMIKYASNAFLAARISFVNEIAGLCEKVGADIKETVWGMGYDSRIGHSYLEAGLGFGGPCLEKDLRALIKIAESNSYEPELLRAVLQRNDRQVEEVISKLKHLSGYLLYKKIVAVFGLTFKAGTNDLRNSMALKVIDRLEKEGAVVQAHDPMVVPRGEELGQHVTCYEDPYETVRHAEALLILTEWPCFSQLDYLQIKGRMAFPRIVDARNLLEPQSLRAQGFSYAGMGRL